VIVLAALAYRCSSLSALMSRVAVLLGLAATLGVALFLIIHYSGAIEGNSGYWVVGFSGALFILLGMSLAATRSALSDDSQASILPWWCFAAAAGSAAALFGSMRSYAVLGDGLLVFASLLPIVPAVVLGWAGVSHAASTRESVGVRQEAALCRQG